MDGETLFLFTGKCFNKAVCKYRVNNETKYYWGETGNKTLIVVKYILSNYYLRLVLSKPP